ncbi:MAG: phosphoribosylformimino-5-aminoimidazole carboxamide ribotide isomerase [Lachnospiraceae bacterium]|nr:phosphoribosylformimino-5-aminoimidazole carboxamide ribotide isomerase [Lachnospiraceae bacterium]
MIFRPCIDIHNGKVKQIVGGSLKDKGNTASENFVSERSAGYYGELFKEKGLTGGHIIILNSKESEYYEASRAQAFEALSAYPGGMQVGGGINADNAAEYIERGASHVIVTSYVFYDRHIDYGRMEKLVKAVGRERLVLDLSCRKTDMGYNIVTDRWQNISNEKITLELLNRLSEYCDEFLVHAVDVEGKNSGIERELVTLLSEYEKTPVTYAGGVHSLEDIALIGALGKSRIDVTVGSALDIYGGKLGIDDIIAAI